MVFEDECDAEEPRTLGATFFGFALAGFLSGLLWWGIIWVVFTVAGVIR